MSNRLHRNELYYLESRNLNKGVIIHISKQLPLLYRIDTNNCITETII